MKKILSLFLCTAIIAALAVPASASSPIFPSDGDAEYTNVIDVSNNDVVTSWAELRQSTSVMYIKATEGTTFSDWKCDDFATGAQGNGISYGFYHYFWPSTTDNARAQADFFYDAIKDYSYDCVPVVDVEESNGCSTWQINECVTAFIDEFEGLSGQPVMIYASTGRLDDFFTSNLGAPLWVADYYSPYLHYPRKMSDTWDSWAMYQYSEDTDWPGVERDGGGGIDVDRATSGIFLGSPAVPVDSQPAPSDSGNYPGFYAASQLDGPINCRAGADFDVLDQDGNAVPGREVSNGDPLVLLGADYGSQLAEVEYPVSDGWMHGYIHNREDLLHNTGYNAWRNGSTPETVYDVDGNIIGSIDPGESADVLQRCDDGRTQVLYSTVKGPETKSGYVWFGGLR